MKFPDFELDLKIGNVSYSDIKGLLLTTRAQIPAECLCYLTGHRWSILQYCNLSKVSHVKLEEHVLNYLSADIGWQPLSQI
jgi:hypothetical protein